MRILERQATCRNATGKLELLGILISFVLVAIYASSAYAAVPAVTSWSSTGGTTQNKDNDQDIMYLVQQGDSLIFAASTSESADYEWQINKVVSANSSSAITDVFNWQVPNDKGIWEIHLMVSNVDGEAHKEWVVSTYSEAEAPDFFDYFTDLVYVNRTVTDPWGRALSDWTRITNYGEISVAQGFMEPLKNNEDGTEYKSSFGTTMPDVLYGTWILQFRFDHPYVGNDGLHVKSAWHFASIDLVDGDNSIGHNYCWADDSHNWLSTRIKGDSADPPFPEINPWWVNGTLSMRGASDIADHMDWTTIRIIHTPDGYFRVWKGDVLLVNGPDRVFKFHKQVSYPASSVSPNTSASLCRP